MSIVPSVVWTAIAIHLCHSSELSSIRKKGWIASFLKDLKFYVAQISSRNCWWVNDCVPSASIEITEAATWVDIRTKTLTAGTKGGAQSRFAVYGNKTDPMGNPVIREETKDGRTTHWCPSVQK